MVDPELVAVGAEAPARLTDLGVRRAIRRLFGKPTTKRGYETVHQSQHERSRAGTGGTFGTLNFQDKRARK
jgi:hypothetical protein